MRFFTQIKLTGVEAAPAVATRSSLADERHVSPAWSVAKLRRPCPVLRAEFNTSVKAPSSMRHRRHLDINQPAAWHLTHCIRQPGTNHQAEPYARPVEAEETDAAGTPVKIRPERSSRHRARGHRRRGVREKPGHRSRDRYHMRLHRRGDTSRPHSKTRDGGRDDLHRR